MRDLLPLLLLVGCAHVTRMEPFTFRFDAAPQGPGVHQQRDLLIGVATDADTRCRCDDPRVTCVADGGRLKISMRWRDADGAPVATDLGACRTRGLRVPLRLEPE